MTTIGDRIKKTRLQKAWKAQDVAKALGITVTSYLNIEADITDVNISKLYEIAGIFEVDVSIFVHVGSLENKDHNMTEINDLKLRIDQYDREITRLQQKVISFYEQSEFLRDIH
ncbi:Transcriptional regulator, contains XRE-family HTH domain [Pedobacter westerhofensis]|uniref:Transcriptional regulator, contains XRE-family HTH domain n=1 Tax=Pedobacter westerhofensis TaxID=425512 RepID=A0A521CS61_9SPHI|nr:helix-turn-helix transcriptional regulator [Pedobacter westerhofensis]SMO61581.1 Transcriptional regulator, contains XRE-family HTH domain [Pedobacter westerhofensis]